MEQEEKKIRMPEPGSLMLSSSPHVHDNSGTAKIMLQVVVCLIPAMLAAVWFFGWDALRVIVACAAFCVGAEYLWNRLMRAPVTIRDCSALLTGVILALNLPPSAPWWLCAVGAVVSIVIAKQVFGGLGQNPFNPAAVGRIALLVGFTGPMTHFNDPKPGAIFGFCDAVTHATDSVTGATPLAAAKAVCGNLDKMDALQTSRSYCDFLIGNTGGSLGETCAIALLIGGIALIALKLIRWQIPLAVLGSMALFTWIVHMSAPAVTPGPLYHLLTGGAMIGAFFMATDTVTSPLTVKGCLIFGAGIGIIASVIRIWGAYPEGMSFAIVIMNALVPLIDKLCYQRPFGWVPVNGGAR